MAICCNEPIVAAPSSRAKATPLFDAAVNFPAGKLSMIIGPSGAGKSTLLQHLAQLDKAPSSVKWFGTAIDRISIANRSQTRAFLPQNTQQNLHFSARDIAKLSNDDPILVDQALAACDASHLADRLVFSLSGGERQRVLLARAIAQLLPNFHEKVLLLDEPVSALDIGLQHKLYGKLKQFCSEGLTVVVVEHDLHWVTRVPDCIGVISPERGYFQVEQLNIDTVAEVYGVAPEIAAAYFNRS